MVDEVLDHVGTFVHAWDPEDGKPRRTLPDHVNQLRIVMLLRDPLLDAGGVPGERATENADRGVRAVLTQHQMGGEITSRPAFAERGRVWTLSAEQPAQRIPFLAGEIHTVILAGLALPGIVHARPVLLKE